MLCFHDLRGPSFRDLGCQTDSISIRLSEVWFGIFRSLKSWFMNQVRDQSARNILVHFISFFVNFSKIKRVVFSHFRFVITLKRLSTHFLGGFMRYLIISLFFDPRECLRSHFEVVTSYAFLGSLLRYVAREDTGALREEVCSNHFAVTSAANEALHMVPVCRCYH